MGFHKNCGLYNYLCIYIYIYIYNTYIKNPNGKCSKNSNGKNPIGGALTPPINVSIVKKLIPIRENLTTKNLTYQLSGKIYTLFMKY